MDERPSTALKTYREKRNFDVTPEPAEGGSANETRRAYVIQKHWASRLHYDFRLELDGTMKSWAVPKGPSFDPADKRMAVRVEDHPISYNSFEGTIPRGQYGAGEVIIWDKGVWKPLEDPHRGYREGKLKFELQGHKLHGRWTLVRMKGRDHDRQEPWLLIKEKDEYVRPAAQYSVVDALPDSVKRLTDLPARQANPASAAGGQARPGRTRTRAAAPPTGGTEAGSLPPAGARAAALPRALQPQLATLVDRLPDDPQRWVFEIKFDGYRMLARAEKGQVKLITRNGNDWSERLPHLQRALQAMDLPDGWYDGEIIMPGDRVAADFQALQGAFDSGRAAAIVYFLFDLPYCAGYDLREVALIERRAVLQRIVERKPQREVRFSAVFDAPPQEILTSACRLGLEGVIGKRANSAYVQRRSSDWIKLKCGHRQEFVIGGYTDPKGSRTAIGSLLLGVHHEDGTLRYAGNVGTGFSEQVLRGLRDKLDALHWPASPFAADAQIPARAHWVRPDLVCEVSFGEWTRSGRIRHSVFLGLRSDKAPVAITREKPRHQAPVDTLANAPGRQGPARSASKATADGDTRPAAAKAELPPALRVTHPERVIDTASGTTKIDLVRYYASVANLMMEHLKGRPVALLRAPSGIGGELFFQKHAERSRMPGVVQLDRALDPGHPALLEVASPEGLLSAAQMNVIEFHTWNAVKRSIAKPDRMTFDLDPGEGVGWPQMQEAAQLVHSFLDELKLAAFLKTSGGKGLHVVVPLKPQQDWDTVKDFSRSIVLHLARTLPQRFVAKSGGGNRVGRIFIDYLRNGFGATTAAAWSARARPGLGISVPVRWDELRSLESGAHWTVASAPSRVAEGNGPWRDYEASRNPLAGAMKTLGYRRR